MNIIWIWLFAAGYIVSLYAGEQALSPQFFERNFDAVRHDLGELAELANQEAMDVLTESRIMALDV
jgi:hypothetical protein